MILLDSNYFLRYLVRPTTPDLHVMAETAKALFEAAARGELEITTTEVVLHEVAYLLASKTHYGVPVADIAAALSTILRLPGFRLPRGEKRRFLRALDLWATYPTLGLPDALIATTAMVRDADLATFDRDFDRIAGLNRWQPPVATS